MLLKSEDFEQHHEVKSVVHSEYQQGRFDCVHHARAFFLVFFGCGEPLKHLER